MPGYDVEVGGVSGSGDGVPGGNGGGGPVRPGPRRILVVDDSATSRSMARLLLGRLGLDLEVALAEGGREALAWLADRPCDLVFLDGLMPGLDGPATAREIRRRELAAGRDPIPIVALTASVLPEDRRLMVDAGMNDLVGKPLEAGALAAALDRWLPHDGATRSSVIPAGDRSSRAGDATPESGAALVDAAALTRLADLGDPTLAPRIVDLLLIVAAERVTEASEAVRAGDAARLEVSLAGLEADCEVIGAVALGRRAREVRQMARSGGVSEPEVDGAEPDDLAAVLELTRQRYQEQLAERR